jgi:hypothetical protein
MTTNVDRLAAAAHVLRGPWTAPDEPGATRYVCPLCDWWHDEPGDLQSALTADEAQRTAALSLVRHVAVLRAHLEAHPLEEWAAAAAALAAVRNALLPVSGAEAPRGDNIDALVAEGRLTVNDARWIYAMARAAKALDQGAPTRPARGSR